MQVLLVEDEPAIADAVLYALESEGVTCVWASTGEAALRHVRDSAPKMVLLDIGLPDINGLDLFRQIRAISNASIVFLTSRSSEIDQVLGLELGADDYITKPFSPRVLSARVRLQLRRDTTSHFAPNTTLFQADEDKRRITLRGQLLDLSRYEYGLLLLLMKNPSRTYSREQLMQLVWASPDESFDRTVDTHIKVLRQKIRAVDASLNPIKTHRGVGYSFEPQ
ncbi:two-component system response regulator CreB [Burkholderiaceae bacterium]|nr:two-component system response regulator CreB [Burkholderiaceae bacterium]